MVTIPATVAAAVEIPTARPVSAEPSPANDVAVTTPATLSPPSKLPNPVAENVPPTPAAPNSTPPLAVTIPTESTLVTSSYVNTPVNVAATPVMFLTVMSGVPVRLDASDAVPVRGPTKPFTAVMIPLVASSVITSDLNYIRHCDAVPMIFSVPAIPVRPPPLP